MTDSSNNDDTLNPFVENEDHHPWRRYVAMGDSFSEGVGDDDELSPHGVRGWADRVAEVLGATSEDFAYANLAVRGKLIAQIMNEQLDAAIDKVRADGTIAKLADKYFPGIDVSVK